MTKIKHDIETGTYKLKISTVQMQLIAKLLSHIELGENVYQRAASDLLQAIEDMDNTIFFEDVNIEAVKRGNSLDKVKKKIKEDNLTIRVL